MDKQDEEFTYLSGAFVVLDGGDGCGKTTVQRLVAEALTRVGLDVVLCKDPGGTEIGNRIRGILLDHDLTKMGVMCETLLFMASRAQLVHEVIKPAMARGSVVLCDRYVSSTCAYQAAIGVDQRTIIELARHATENTWPDLTVIVDVPIEIGFQRIKRRLGIAASEGKTSGTQLDAMERRPAGFHERVRQNFMRLHECYPAPTAIVDGTGSAQEVVTRVLDRLALIERVKGTRTTGK